MKKYLTVTELTEDQLFSLKQEYLRRYFEECEDGDPSLEELANAGSIIDNAIIFEAYEGTLFTLEDFPV